MCIIQQLEELNYILKCRQVCKRWKEVIEFSDIIWEGHLKELSRRNYRNHHLDNKTIKKWSLIRNFFQEKYTERERVFRKIKLNAQHLRDFSVDPLEWTYPRALDQLASKRKAHRNRLIDLEFLFCGASKVGKSSTILSLLKKEHQYLPDTLEPSVVSEKTESGHAVSAVLKDSLASCDGDLTITPNIDVLIYIFAVDDRSTLSFLEKVMIPQVGQEFAEKPFLLVGNKADTANKASNPVRYEEGCQIAHRLGAVQYFEISAKNQTNATRLFDFLLNLGLCCSEE